MADTSRSIETVVNGLHGPIEVNGQQYNGTMPPMGHLKDEEIAEILSYVRSSWGNAAHPVSAGEVAAVRAKTLH
jgi:mono/diheme cytochrome c family protein